MSVVAVQAAFDRSVTASQAGFFTSVFLGSPEHPEDDAAIDRLAARYGAPPIAIATAWITRHPAA